jgi:hypothetical protein
VRWSRLYLDLQARGPGDYTAVLEQAVRNLRIDLRDLGYSDADAEQVITGVTEGAEHRSAPDGERRDQT